MDSTDRKLEDQFSAFEKDLEPALLQKALEMISRSEQATPALDRAEREHRLGRWLRFFETLDKHIDPEWDPEDVPVTGLVPPPVHGVTYPSGVDPKVIADPEIRAQYEAALKASKEHAEHYRIQHELRRIEQRALGSLEQWLQEQYSSPSSRREFEALLADSGMSDERKEHLKDYFSRME